MTEREYIQLATRWLGALGVAESMSEYLAMNMADRLFFMGEDFDVDGFLEQARRERRLNREPPVADPLKD